MHRIFLFMLIMLPVAGCTPALGSIPATTTPFPSPFASSPASATSFPLNDPDLTELATEYRYLRPTPGHFGGGDWNDAVDLWGGRKHTLMQALAARLSNRDINRSALTNLLGSPDQIVGAGDDLWPLLTSGEGAVSDADAFLVYQWRGAHDFLYFISHGGVITGSAWWYAGE